MLACLPGPGEPSFPLLSHPQMNTGLQKWDTTQKMRAAQHPTPAELDAYAKKVANHPLTIKIFPNSVKVPQRKHVRRTVNGLDTSGQRYSPYPPPPPSSSSQSQQQQQQVASAKTGLLAIVRPPSKGIVKDFEGTRSSSRLLLPSEAMMSHPYATPSTLSHHPPQAALARQHLPGMATHAQGVPPTLQPPPQHPQNMAHAALQQQQQPPPPTAAPPQQPPQPHLLPQPPLPSGSAHGGGRKLSEADAPPNVTVSTSTIPLSMAATLQQNQAPDLSSIVHQINQFCQARAGASATSVCEGQIANPSPISRNLLISASTRVSAHGVPTPLPSCLVHPGDHPAPVALPLAGGGGGGGGRGGPLPAYQSEMKQAAASAWNQHHLAQLHQMCGETLMGPSGLMGKPPGPREQGFGPGKASGYPLELCLGQPFHAKPPLEKPTPSPPPPVNGLPPGPLPYANGHYFQPLWNNLLPTPNSDSSGSQDLALPFHGPPGPQAMAPALECPAGPHYRAAGQSGAMPTVEYLSGDFQHSCLREQPGGIGIGMGKGARPSAANRAPAEPGPESRSLHIQHPGYR